MPDAGESYSRVLAFWLPRIPPPAETPPAQTPKPAPARPLPPTGCNRGGGTTPTCHASVRSQPSTVRTQRTSSASAGGRAAEPSHWHSKHADTQHQQRDANDRTHDWALARGDGVDDGDRDAKRKNERRPNKATPMPPIAAPQKPRF